MLLEAVKQFVVEQEIVDRPLTVALSGGADSVAMLLLLNELKKTLGINLSAIHVNHGLSQNASQWMRFCRQLCERLHVPIHCVELTIEKRSRKSLEQVAREARYRAMGELMSSRGVLFTGHHSHDQFETFLLRLMRGAGLTGLGAMRPITDYPLADSRFIHNQVARPLLSFSKKDLVNYLIQQRQSWVEDESNESDAFDRNFIRNNLIPLFESRWPTASVSVEHSTEILQADSDLLNEYLDDDLEFCVEEGFAEHRVLDLDAVELMSGNKRSALLRRFCQLRTGQALSRNALMQLEQQMFSHNQDAQPKVKLDEYWALRFQHRLYIVADTLLAEIESDAKAIMPNNRVELSGVLGGFCIELKVMDETLEFEQFEIRFAHLSDKMQLNENGGSKPVKQLLKDMGCPPWWRGQIPLVYNDGELVAVADKYVEMDFQGKLNVEIAKK